MFSLIGGLIRFCFLTIGVLLLSQVPVKNKRICDHVGDWVSQFGVNPKKPLAWIGNNFKFTQQQTKRVGAITSSKNESHHPDTEITDPDRAALSGLLKTIQK